MIDPALPIFRERIRPAFIELIQGLLDQTPVVIIRGRPSKKCQARAKFEIIERQEFAGRICMRGVTSNDIVAQAFSQGRIIEVALGLIEVANRVALRHGAVAQAGNLRENEYNPVGPLVPRGQFFDDPGVPEACASTKRTRSGSVTRAARVH